tara:strand:+ start:7340 stop:7501 length:162 start_codon:yes stop_codon:yes gene_type:complete
MSNGITNDELFIIGGIIIITSIAVKYILKYHNLRTELMVDVVLAEDPLVIYTN